MKLFNLVEIHIEPREEVTLELTILITVAAIGFALAIAGVIFAAYRVNPLTAYWFLFWGSFGSTHNILETFTRMIPLLLCAIGLIIAYRALIWNIGSEGQLLLGAIAAAGIALFVPGIPPALVLPTMIVAGFISGAAWAFIPGILKAKYNVNEIITTLMMNYIAARLIMYLVYGPWQGQYVWGFPYTDIFPDYAWMPTLGTRLHYPDLILAILIAIGSYYLLERTTLGYEIKVIGSNKEAGRYAGMSYFKVVLFVMIFSGGLAGIAGAAEVAGITHRLMRPEAISPGYGYTAIIVAWLARLNPLIGILAALFMAIILVGGQQIQISMGLPFGVVNMFNGIFLFSLIAFELFRKYHVKVRLVM